ncbi:hypothetical protein [Hydrogenophaga laconesensis]|uniref:Branched-chain amino acid transport protein (AzlD) n=1 Tax=Hydrogenophaga laconesensis TaxID=1805971 RepID=A0ABU1VJK8_9BURK|nr:hypothetical protein [Hydrogenophaga laconesensis]MDR7097624.1 hypothetical protein [Hydrogenophaga laconesensis]
MTAVVSALLAAALLSMLFASTRAFGIVCIVLLCYLKPILAACLIVLAITFVLYLFK